jgi:hypothetical protein
MRRRRVLLRALIVLYVLGVGFLGGMLSERMRFDVKRTVILAELDAAVAEAHGRLMALERLTAVDARAESAMPAADRSAERAFP